MSGDILSQEVRECLYWHFFCTVAKEFFFIHGYMINIKHSYLIQITHTKLYGFKYAYLILIIYKQFYDLK